MIYKSFTIENYKGIDKVSISLVKDDLVLLLGLNESGKTTILRAIETFDYLNDQSNDYKDNFFRSIRNKSDVSSNKSAKITAIIHIDKKLKIENFKRVSSNSLYNNPKSKLALEGFINHINTEEKVIISRIIPFKNGNPQEPYYKFESNHIFTKEKIANYVAKDIVTMCPFIIYFEDFKDRIPEKIFTHENNDAFNSDWYDIIDGLFYNTNENYSIKGFKRYHSNKNPRPQDAKTVLKRVNKTLNSSFSDKWKILSGVQDIEDTELTYNKSKAYFEISITDTNGTTYTVDERSKGALWYLSFLMKTEFRRKKMRMNSGKPIFLIDEPASNLHSTAQQNMIQDFQTLVEDTSVIYSTHSQYLISLNNIKTTYVIERDEGLISSTLWSDYIKKDKSNQTYYQPLANLLNIVPNSFDIPWAKAIITEGPSDMNVLFVMYYTIKKKKVTDFVIYPGTSAQNLEAIISLNIGWNSDFHVLLDSDREGKKAKNKYVENFNLDSNKISTLPIDNKKIESYFSEDEKKKIYELAFEKKKENSKVNKKEFASSFSIINSNEDKLKKVRGIIDKETITKFEELFKIII